MADLTLEEIAERVDRLGEERRLREEDRALREWEKERAEEARAQALNPPPNWNIERATELRDSGLDTDQIDRIIREEAPQRKASGSLEDEFSRYFDALGRRGAEIAHRSGLPQEIIMNRMVGIARIRMTGDGLWEPDAKGPEVFVTPIRVEPGAPPYAVRSVKPLESAIKGEMIDIVAWRPKVPDKWALRTGAGMIMGTAEFHLSADDAPAPRITRGPVEWLRAGGEGIGLLTRDKEEIRWLLFGFDRVTADDLRLREQLRQALYYGPRTIVDAPRREVEVAQLRPRRSLHI